MQVLLLPFQVEQIVDSTDQLLLQSAFFGVTVQPAWAIRNLMSPEGMNAAQIALVGLTVVLLPVWGIFIARAVRYWTQRKTPSRGFASGDRVIARGKKSTLKHRMMCLPLIIWDQPWFGFGADTDSWWALTDDGEWITAHALVIEHLPVLDRLSEI